MGLLLTALAAGCSADPNSPVETSRVERGVPTAGEDGAACLAAFDCFGGVCLSEFEHGFPNGYCTTFGCDDSPCYGGTCVVAEGGTTSCLDTCIDSTDCRHGYNCLEQNAIFICKASGEPGIEVGESPNGECVSGCTVGDPVRIDCGFTPSRLVEGLRDPEGEIYQFALPYRLTQGIAGFGLSVWPEEGDFRINLISARNDADGFLDLKGVDAALNITSFVDNDYAVTTVPFAPAYADFVAGGAGLLQVQSAADSLCMARSEGREGTLLDLDLYLVGASGLQAASIALDPDFVAVLDEMRRLFALAGLEIDRVRPYDVEESLVDRYRLVRDPEQLGELLELTVDPLDRDGEDRRDPMTVNIVMVDDIMLRDGREIVGQSGLLPGPPGLHGTPYSGVIVETVDLREEPKFLAMILAHEVSHYLGLRHTTELFDANLAFGNTDPLDDTPECPDVVAVMDDCPDFENLMYPLAPPYRDPGETVLSEDQGWVLRRSPLVR
jgi:hypothetical protein